MCSKRSDVCSFCSQHRLVQLRSDCLPSGCRDGAAVQTQGKASFPGAAAVSLMQRDVTSDGSDFGCLSFKKLRTLLLFLILFFLIRSSIRKDSMNFNLWTRKQKPEGLLSAYQRSTCWGWALVCPLPPCSSSKPGFLLQE